MARIVTGLELVHLLRDLIDMSKEIIDAPPFSRMGRQWYRECLALLRGIRPALAEEFSHIPFGKDSVHVEPSWKQPGHPRYEEVKNSFILGTKTCANLLNTAAEQIDQNHTYTLPDEPGPDEAEHGRWYQKPAYLKAIAPIFAAVFTAVGVIGSALVSQRHQPERREQGSATVGAIDSAYVSQSTTKVASDAPSPSSIVDVGEKELLEGKTADVFQTNDLIFVGVSASDGDRPRARLVTSGFSIPKLGTTSPMMTRPAGTIISSTAANSLRWLSRAP